MKVSGVGERKQKKYGNRFLCTIASFKEAYPHAVTSLPEKQAEGSSPIHQQTHSS